MASSLDEAESKVNQLVAEAVTKCVETVLSLRLSAEELEPLMPAKEPTAQYTRFGMTVPVLTKLRSDMVQWCKEPDRPLQLELHVRSTEYPPAPGPSETMLERWVFDFERLSPEGASGLVEQTGDNLLAELKRLHLASAAQLRAVFTAATVTTLSPPQGPWFPTSYGSAGPATIPPGVVASASPATTESQTLPSPEQRVPLCYRLVASHPQRSSPHAATFPVRASTRSLTVPGTRTTLGCLRVGLTTRQHQFSKLSASGGETASSLSIAAAASARIPVAPQARLVSGPLTALLKENHFVLPPTLPSEVDGGSPQLQPSTKTPQHRIAIPSTPLSRSSMTTDIDTPGSLTSASSQKGAPISHRNRSTMGSAADHFRWSPQITPQTTPDFAQLRRYPASSEALLTDRTSEDTTGGSIVPGGVATPTVMGHRQRGRAFSQAALSPMEQQHHGDNKSQPPRSMTATAAATAAADSLMLNQLHRHHGQRFSGDTSSLVQFTPNLTPWKQLAARSTEPPPFCLGDPTESTGTDVLLPLPELSLGAGATSVPVVARQSSLARLNPKPISSDASSDMPSPMATPAYGATAVPATVTNTTMSLGHQQQTHHSPFGNRSLRPSTAHPGLSIVARAARSTLPQPLREAAAMQVQLASSAKPPRVTRINQPDEATAEDMPTCLEEEMPAFACGTISTQETPWWLLAAMAQAQQRSDTVW